ncbi:hypothetical protein HPB50_020393 [Hyalomma asiaticum]|uniref:Uncharacterized protein n=1 Tax=Hyalomma asiaticum TaxID=266040 RepID=A0ACB7RNM1_HYAAI|nr:hypothetical protein HPB50_020393 [Hyalomma asiaticum]
MGCPNPEAVAYSCTTRPGLTSATSTEVAVTTEATGTASPPPRGCNVEDGDFPCLDGRCLLPVQVCDGVRDCGDGADEGRFCPAPPPRELAAAKDAAGPTLGDGPPHAVWAAQYAAAQLVQRHTLKNQVVRKCASACKKIGRQQQRVFLASAVPGATSRTRLTSLETWVNFFLSSLLEWDGVGEGAIVSRVWNIVVMVRALVLAPVWSLDRY